MAASENKRKKPHAIVLDLDDTIVGFVDFLCRLHNSLYDTSVTDSDVTKWNFQDLDVVDARGKRVLGEDLARTFAEYESHGLYASLPAIKDARFAIQLMQKLGYKIIIVTARKEEHRKQTVLNLIHQKIHHDELILSHDKPATIKELSKKYHIDAFVDDRSKNVLDVSQNCRIDQIFIINKAHNQDVIDEDIIRVNNLFETVRYLKEVK